MEISIKISIVIPVYNAEKYLSQCIESVCNQTLQEIEIIVVNDGSTDNSYNIIKEWQPKDSRIKFIDSANLGVSNARNLGLDAARGQYIGFIDADDWVETDMFQQLSEMISSNDSDLAICNIMVHQNSNKSYERLKLVDEKIDIESDKLSFLNMMMDFRFDYSNWNKLYKREIIIENKIRFVSGMKIWEDLLFNLQYTYYASKVILVNQSLYHYRIHEESVMSKSNPHLIGQFNVLFESYQSFCETQEEKKMFDFFNHKMAEIVYNNLIPRFCNKIKNENRSNIYFVKTLNKYLKEFNNQIFNYSQNKLSGFQGFKRRLLMKGNYRLFSIIAGVRILIKN